MNNEAYARLKDEINKKYAGRYVAIASGGVVAVETPWKRCVKRLKRGLSRIG